MASRSPAAATGGASQADADAQDAYFSQHVRSMEAALAHAVNAAVAARADDPVAFIGRHLLGDEEPPRAARAAREPPHPVEIGAMEAANVAPRAELAPPGGAARRLSAASLEEATARYTGVGALRGLLTHDAALGGVPIKLLSARWVLDFFQAAANASARLEHRQALEREHPEAFVAGEAVERLLAEVEAGKYVAEAPGGGYEALQSTDYAGKKWEVEVAFPSVVAMSHMWLDPSHPDPAARNLREMWLPALEWYYSERVRQLAHPRHGRATDASGAALSDEAVRAAADFGLFVDLASMCQKEDDKRTPAEDALFRHALGSLDVVYAHARTASFLSTRLPEGAGVGRGYDDRGWTCFERAEGELIKPDSRCIDIGLFTVDKAFEKANTVFRREGEGVRIGGAPCAERSVKELARQGSYYAAGRRGLLGDLVGARRGAPLSPEAFGEVLGTKTFTNDADAGGVLGLYRKTATALLGSARELKYEKLEWGAADYAHLGGALRYCGALESLTLESMGLGDADAAAVLVGEPLALKELRLFKCKSLTALPDLSALASLQTLNLRDCSSLTALPDLSALAALQELNLWGCSSLTALPDLSARKELKVENVPDHARAWKEGGFKAWSGPDL